MPRRISNPDAPVVEHYCILVTENDMPHWVAPVLFSRIPEYDPKVGDVRYLEMRLMAIDRDTAKPILRDDKPVMFQPREVEGFFAQIGNNTSYILHPEETREQLRVPDHGKQNRASPTGDSRKKSGLSS